MRLYMHKCGIFTLRTTSFGFAQTYTQLLLVDKYGFTIFRLEPDVCVCIPSMLLLFENCSFTQWLKLSGKTHFGMAYELHQFVCPHYVSIFFCMAGALCIIVSNL